MSNFTNLDYTKIKDSLIEFLKTVPELRDYDFSASGLQQLLSLLAYNTAYNAFYLNMVGAEMFLDSAQMRESIVSRAKLVGYVPSSPTASRAKVRIEVDTNSGPLPTNPPFVSLTTTDEFQAYLDGKTYLFTPDKTYLIEKNADGKYVADVTLVEGKRLTFRYVVDTTGPIKQRFIIPNLGVDLDTLNVKVKESESSSAIKIYSQSSNITSLTKRTLNINELTKDSLAYFIQESDGGYYEVYFGDDILGAQPKTGNIVILEYLVTSGSIANGLKSFARVGKPTGYNTIKLTTLEAAKGGSERESNESIKLLAPLLYQAQDRAVTKNDYEALIRKDNPNVQYVRVWGGEEHSPPDYGKVYAAIKPKTGTRLSTNEKNSIVQQLLKERGVVSVEVRIIDPDYLYMKLTTKVNFRSKRTTLNGTDIKQNVFNKIVEYSTQTLNGFDADFTYSKLLTTIDSVDQSIIGNNTSIQLKKRIYPAYNNPTRFELKFHNALSKGDATNDRNSVTSSGYIYRGVTTYIGDDGKGDLYLYRLVDNRKVVIQRGVGSVDYDAGVVVINAFDVQDIELFDYVEIVATPLENDIYTPRESILLLEKEDIGVYVDAVDIVGEVI